MVSAVHESSSRPGYWLGIDRVGNGKARVRVRGRLG